MVSVNICWRKITPDGTVLLPDAANQRWLPATILIISNSHITTGILLLDYGHIERFFGVIYAHMPLTEILSKQNVTVCKAMGQRLCFTERIVVI